MRRLGYIRSALTLALFALAAATPATATPPAASPVAKLQDLVGTWNCTYRAGTTVFPYVATYAYDREAQTLRQLTTWAGGGAEELVGYDAKRHGFTVVVYDGQGTVTIMRGLGGNAGHFAYRSVYPDPSIADVFDRTSANEYRLHATVQMGGKTVASADTCLRAGT